MHTRCDEGIERAARRLAAALLLLLLAACAASRSEGPYVVRNEESFCDGTEAGSGAEPEFCGAGGRYVFLEGGIAGIQGAGPRPSHRARFKAPAVVGDGVVHALPDISVTVAYAIGAPLADEVSREANPALRALLRRRPTDLMVQFKCSVCDGEDSAFALMPLRYNERLEEWGPVEFTFTPRMAPAGADAPPLGEAPGVTFVVWRGGVPFDEFHVRIVRAPPETAAAETAPRPQQPVAPVGQPFDTEPDAVLELARPGPEPFLTPILTIRSEAVAEAVNRVLETREAGVAVAAGERILGNPRFASLAALETRARASYMMISCLTVADKPANRAARADWAGRVLCAPYRNVGHDWSPGPAGPASPPDLVAADLYRIGALIYGDMIERGSKVDLVLGALAEVSQTRLASRAGRPVRLLFSSPQVRLPVQLLHRPLAGAFHLDRERPPAFFGMVFDLADEGLGTYAPESAKRPRHPPRAGAWGAAIVATTVFGGYRGAADWSPGPGDQCPEIADEAAALSCQHFLNLKRALVAHGGQDFAPRLKSQVFVEDLARERGVASLIWTYLHGRTREDAAPAGVGANPRLVFGVEPDGRLDVLSPGLLDQVQFLTLADPPAFKAFPLVGLIACETGAAVVGGTSGRDFENAFFGLGAGGVITTEAEIESVTAENFGAGLVAALAEDASLTPSEAMLRTRFAMFKAHHGNLWTLLFHYSGAHGIKFRKDFATTAGAGW